MVDGIQYKIELFNEDQFDEIFKKMDAKPSDFLNSFEKSVKDVSKKFKVSEKELLGYFEKEMLSL